MLELDAQQELLIKTLQRAGGATVSYEELREAGIELPASVVSELELAGVPVERRWQDRGGTRRLGARLDPGFDPIPPRPEAAVPRDHLSARSLAPLGLVVVVALVVAGVVLMGLGGGRAHRRVAHHPTPAHARAPAVAGVTNPVTTPAPPPIPVSPGLATQSEAQGHDLLEAGQYSQAVPVLKRAVHETGEQLNSCLEPVSQTCLTYAYALYDLGRALQMDGDATAAVPVLERRLQIDNQRGVVQTELAVARAGAS